MDDRLKETLSAMMDDQADELAIRRLLSRAELPEVRQQWQRWQSMQSLMHDDRRAFATLDVSAAVQDALSEKTATSVAVATPQARQVQSRSARWSAVAAVRLRCWWDSAQVPSGASPARKRRRNSL